MPSGVTVVIPNWNKADLLDHALASLARQSLAPEAVLVLDNGSTDHSHAIAQRHGARFIPLGSNLGFAAAVNRGVQLASTLWVAIVNNDVELHPLWLASLVQQALESSAWFAAPRLIQLSNPSRLDGAFDLLTRSGCAWRAGFNAPNSAPFLTPRAISFAPFTALLLRRGLFDQAGPLDERFHSYLEDVDFCLRSALLGLSGIYVPAAIASHLGSATLGPSHPKQIELISRNQLLLAAKHFPLSYSWRVLAGQLLWGALATRQGNFLAWLRGKLAAFRLFSSIRASSSRAPTSLLDPILRSSERQIRDLQQSTHREPFWRAYFLVAP
jgi:GT2 family glycosyltransferase